VSCDDLTEDSTGWRSDAAIAVPVSHGHLPDGTATLIIGDVRGCAAFNHVQGDNADHDSGDCGIVCCADVLGQFGLTRTEAELVAHATRRRELHVVPGHPEQSGWTRPSEQAALLRDYGVAAHEETGQPVERLAVACQRGHGVIAAVNAGVLWGDASCLGNGQANHAVTVTGVARDPYDGALEGLFINDSGNGQSGQFVSAHLMTTAFVRTGGFCVITDNPRPAGPAG
jgi:hypothetical protein